MKLATVAINNRSFPALISGDSYINISAHFPDAPRSMVELIEQWDNFSVRVKELESAKVEGKLEDVSIEAPIRRPGKIFAIGLNYADHCEETNMDLPDKQIWFTKATTATHPPFAPLEIPPVSDSLDYEIEMVVVIGKRCKNVPKERFEEVVFGYATGNDVSVREWQIATSQWSLGKSFDCSAPFGPWITTKDEVTEPHELDVQLYVNDELRQSSNTKHLVFKVGDMIEQLSHAMTLEPGDVIFTGTPGGVGFMWDDEKPVYLKSGDIVRGEVESLGSIQAVVKKGSSQTIIA